METWWVARWFDDEVLFSEGDLLLVQHPMSFARVGWPRRRRAGSVGPSPGNRLAVGLRTPADDYVWPFQVKVAAPA